MPGKIKVKVLAGRNLPVMDRAGETTDAFVEIKFGGITHKTDVCRKSLNPHWNSTEWYRFEVDESELQDEPLQLRLMDHDTYSANDAIGKVVISLAPLLAREANIAKGTAGPPGGAVMSGWIPVFDTMHGIRGELNVIVKVELFSDFNKYKTSSCGVQFFHCPMIPPGYRATSIHGFVEELVVNDDPEYQWIDKIRTPRASNEARQVAFIKLSNQVQRLVGLKAAELGANAVVGYQQDFDLEGEAGVVARAIGTAVSITPLPLPSQLINIPPCTQQQLKKYLDILATDDESITDLNQYYQTHQDELQKMLTILSPNASSLLDEADVVDEDEKSMDMTRQSSLTSYAGSVSLYQDDYASQKSLRHLSEDQIDLNRLLNRTDGYDSDSNSPLQKIKKLKTNFFSKRFQGMRSRKSDKQDDQISLKSTSSDTSRITLDIKNELKKLQRLKKPKLVRKAYVNKEDEGVGMASILARSVIHARTSLACIAETQDSENSPGSTLRHNSESEPTMNKSDDDKPKPTNTEMSMDKSDDTKLPEIRFTSLGNIKSDEVESETIEVRRKISESCPTTPIVSRSDNLLKLPGDVGYFGSVSSALSASGESSEFYSSSDEDDESSDVRTDTERSIETTSSVVQSVLSHEVDPVLISQMEKKLSILINEPPDDSELKKMDETESEQPKTIVKEPAQEIESNDKIEISFPDNAEPSTSVQKETETFVAKPNNPSIKLHNPFAHKKASKSISAPSSPVEKSSFVYRSSKRIKRQLSKLSNSSMIKSLSHYSLLPKKKHETKTLSRPVSSSDLPSKTPSDTVLGSPFMSYADLLSLDSKGIDVYKSLYKSDDLDRAKVSMYIGSEPVSRASFSGSLFPYNARDEHHFDHKKEKPSLKPTGLVHTAMETILIDKVQSLLLPTSPDSESAKTKQFFEDVSDKLEKVEEDRNKKDSTSAFYIETSKGRSLVREISPDYSSFIKKQQFDEMKNCKASDGKRSHHESTGLIHTAVETMLIDRVQSLLGPTTPEPVTEKQVFHEPHIESHKAIDHHTDDKESSGLVHTAMQTILMDKVTSLIGRKTPENDEKKCIDDYSDTKSESCSSVHTVKEKTIIGKLVPFDDKTEDSTGLVHTAVETMLMDKFQSLLGPKYSDSFSEQQFFEKYKQELGSAKEPPKKDNESSGIVHSAMETMLMDKVQSLLGLKSPDSLSEQQFFEEHKPKLDSAKEPSKRDNESSGLVHTAMETMLMDKVQSLLGPKCPDSSSEQLLFEEHKPKLGSTKEPFKKDNVSSGLEHTAMETILIDKMQSLLPKTTDTSVSSQKIENETDKINESVEEKETSFVHTAMETILMDNVQSLISPTKPHIVSAIPKKAQEDKNEKSEESGLLNTAIQTILMDTVQSLHAPVPESDPTKDLKEGIKPNDPITDSSPKKDKKLVRQDSIHSVTEKESQMSNEIVPNIVTPYKATKQSPVLQHFHPILSGAPLETIPSLPEGSLDHAESLDIEGVEETNTASVCGNSHAACRFDRSERDRDRSEKDKGSPRHARHESYGSREPVVSAHAHNSSLNASSTPMGIHRRSSDSDLSVTPKGGSLNTSAVNVGSGGGAILRPSMNSNNLDMLEYPFLTMTEYPPGFIVHIGGTVCARSVKLVDGGGESALRAAWWAELRTELRAHARALRCNAVIAYVDTAAICEDVCVLSASGTAAVINLECDYNIEVDTASVSGGKAGAGGGGVACGTGTGTGTGCVEEGEEVCSVGHVPYSPGAGPYRVELSTCGGCRRARVPAVLLATCTKPNKLTSYAKAVTLTAVAARLRRAPPTGEPAARDISDQLPFLEYELHKLLLAKLRMQGANALFSLQTQIAIGERFVMALASGTAFRVTALPPPTPPRIKASENDRDALEIQKALWDSFTANRTANGYDVGVSDHNTNGVLPEVEGEEAPALDLCADKDACVLELDEAEDVETARALAARRTHMRVFTSCATPARGATPHAFAQVWRGRLTVSGQAASPAAERHVSRALDGVAYKLRRLQPCALVAPRFQLELPEDEIQLVVSGAAIPLQDPSKPEVNANGTEAAPGNHGNGTGDADDDIFTLDEEQLVKSSHSEAEEKNSITGHAPRTVSLTSLAALCGAAAARRVCALRLLFVRETTAVRELGGLSGFLHTFTCEVLAIVRAYTAALGGNALTSFYITQLMLQDNAHKNQGQCLLSVGGDVVHVTY